MRRGEVGDLRAPPRWSWHRRAVGTLGLAVRSCLVVVLVAGVGAGQGAGTGDPSGVGVSVGHVGDTVADAAAGHVPVVADVPGTPAGPLPGTRGTPGAPLPSPPPPVPMAPDGSPSCPPPAVLAGLPGIPALAGPGWTSPAATPLHGSVGEPPVSPA